MILYSVGIWTYRQGVRAAALAGHHKASLLDAGLRRTLPALKERLADAGTQDNSPKETVWIHAASLGEFEQGRPLIERLRRERPGTRIVLSFFSPSGYEVRKNYSEADAVVYLPFDTPRNVRRFLDAVRPTCAIFVKYEFWLNYLSELKRRGIPTYLISGIFRPSQLFFRPYGGFYRNALKAFTTLYLQDEGSRRLLEGIGVTNTEVAGDTRFDRVTDIMKTAREDDALTRFCGRGPARGATGERTPGTDLIFIAGSSWPEDESNYAGWLRDTPGVKGIIAPHEFSPERLAKMLELFEGEGVLLSGARKDPSLLDTHKVLIMDCFGMLASAYAYADIAYVGGGFGAGLHNINEAAVYGIPVIYGPNNAKFIEAQEMKATGGGIEVHSREDFRREASRLIADDAYRLDLGRRSAAYITSRLGATSRIFDSLFR